LTFNSLRMMHTMFWLSVLSHTKLCWKIHCLI